MQLNGTSSDASLKIATLLLSPATGKLPGESHLVVSLYQSIAQVIYLLCSLHLVPFVARFSTGCNLAKSDTKWSNGTADKASHIFK